jgi:DNA invertase Pin-like site-specific DNA recombinase
VSVHEDPEIQPAQRWAIYIRVSTKPQMDGFSLDDQREQLINYADEQGWDWHLYEDAGVSGETFEGRQGLMSVLDDIDAGRVVGVLVVDESRLLRTDLVAAQIKYRLKEAQASLATPGRGVINLDDPTQGFLFSVISAAHVLEQDLRRNRMIIGLRRTAEAGFWPGGPAPYGYQRVPSDDGKHTVLAIDDDEAKVLRLAAKLIVENGHTTYSAALQINSLGARTRTGKRWRPSNLAGQLRQERTTGVFTYDPRGACISLQIPNVFTLQRWDALQAAIRGTPRGTRKNRLYPLTGRGRCHLRCACGGNFYGYSDNSKRNKVVYACSRNELSLGDERCPHYPRVTQATTLEQEVWKRIIDALLDTDYLETLVGNHIAQNLDGQVDTGTLQRRLTELSNEETRIVRALAKYDDIHRDALDRALFQVTQERSTIRRELDRITKAQTASIAVDQVPKATRRYAALARTKLDNPSEELMTEIFDLIELDLVRVEHRTFEGSARLPLPDMEAQSEVWEEALQRMTCAGR